MATKRSLRICTNVENPYNGGLYSALTQAGWNLDVLYKTLPGAIGRDWPITQQPEARVAGALSEACEMLLRPSENTIVSGGYHEWRDVVRIASASGRETRLSFWGERLQERSLAVRLCQRQLFRPFQQIFAIGSWAQASYLRVTDGRIPVHVFPYGLPSPTVSAHRSDEAVVGFAGSLIERKGVASLLHAVARISVGRPRVEIIGSGPEKEALEQLAYHLGLEVEWYGELQLHDMDKIRRRWWAQVVPSVYDGWAMVVPEAMAMGVPVIATRSVGAALDLVLPGVTGELVRQPADLSVAIRRVLEPDHQKMLAENAFRLGSELVAHKGAKWLGEVLADAPKVSHSFVADAHAAARASGLSRPSRSVAVVLNWKRWDLTSTCVASLRKSPDLKVLVVDNGRVDDVTEHQAARSALVNDPSCDVVFSGGNLGFSRGCNVGLIEAFADPLVENAILVNNDLVVTSGDFVSLNDLCAGPEVGLVGVPIRLSGGDRFWFTGGHWRRLLRNGKVYQPRIRGHAVLAAPYRTGFVTGAFMCIPRRTYEALGGLDERFFFGGEEWEYSRRVKSSGRMLLVDPGVDTEHLSDGSHSNSSPPFLYNSVRNRLQLSEVGLSPWLRPIWLWIYREYIERYAGKRLAPWHGLEPDVIRSLARLAFRNHAENVRVDEEHLSEVLALFSCHDKASSHTGASSSRKT